MGTSRGVMAAYQESQAIDSEFDSHYVPVLLSLCQSKLSFIMVKILSNRPLSKATRRFFFNSDYIEVQGRTVLIFLDCSTWSVPYNAEC